MERISAKRQGKMRARDEGSGGVTGAVLNLTLIDSAFPQSAYALPVQVGSNTFSLEIDIGSSDTWIASTSCSTAPCNAVGTRYDPSGSTSLGQNFELNYLRGKVAGPIVSDQISLGPYTLKQAFAAANSVTDEPLTSIFVGLLGLALPSDSFIATQIKTPANGNTVAQNVLFSSSSPPNSKFLSLALERPGSDTVPSLLGIGAHPQFIKDPSAIKYASLIGGTSSQFWNTGLSGLSVFTDGQEHKFPVVGEVATLDSGIPVIVTTTDMANAIYGTIGIGPSPDGNYYFQCTVPLNITVIIGSTAVPLHPLDLSVPTGNNDGMCRGMIQASDAAFSNPAIGNFILGVPFMRNVYTVMAYQPPNPDGTFTATGKADINPRLGILPLTDVSVATREFHTVRVEHKSLGGHHPVVLPATTSNGLSTGIKIAIGAGAIVFVCALVFAVRFCFVRYRYKRSQRLRVEEEKGLEAEKGRANFARMHRDSSAGGYALATFQGDTLRGSTFGDLRQTPIGGTPGSTKEARDSYFSNQTLVAHSHSQSSGKVGEFGVVERMAAADVVLPVLPHADEQGHVRRPSDTPLLAPGSRFADAQRR